MNTRLETIIDDSNLAWDNTFESKKEIFIVENFIGGFDVPWGMAFLPNGKLLVSDRNGTLWLVDKNGEYKVKITGVPKVKYKVSGLLSVAGCQPELSDWLDKLGPFGNGSSLPTFFFKDLKIIKTNILDEKHIAVIFKPKVGSSIKSICFNCMNTKIAEHLLSYRKNINIIAQINENIWNNKKTLQLNIKDVFL